MFINLLKILINKIMHFCEKQHIFINEKSVIVLLIFENLLR